MHRLQIGLSGLAAMLLLVGLANIIMDRARQNEAASGIAPSSAAVAGAKADDAGDAADPLAAAGAAPNVKGTPAK